MCEFTVMMDDEVVARKVIKAKERDGCVVMADTAGKVLRIDGAHILNVDTIMAEMVLSKAGPSGS
jgi:predicted RNA-binding protein